MPGLVPGIHELFVIFKTVIPAKAGIQRDIEL